MCAGGAQIRRARHDRTELSSAIIPLLSKTVSIESWLTLEEAPASDSNRSEGCNRARRNGPMLGASVFTVKGSKALPNH